MSHTPYMSTGNLDDNYISNRQTKMIMYYTHLSDTGSSISKSLTDNKRSASSLRHALTEEIKEDQAIDFLIPPKEGEDESKIKGRHFQIKYQPKRNQYYAKDLGIGYGIFVSIEKSHLIKDSILLNMCQTYIVVNLSYDKYMILGNTKITKEMMPDLKLKVFGGTAKGEEYIFDKDKKSIILIGRSDSCDVQIKDKLLSRVQGTVTFDEKQNSWVIHDGYKNRKSTNGIWM